MAHPLVPLLILVIVICVAAVVGYVVYSIANDIADKTAAKMERSNVSFGRDGLKIGLKEVKEEDYVAQTQNFLVKAWNYSTWPAYKSRFWNKDASAQPSAASHSGSPAGSGSASSAAHTSGHTTGSKAANGPSRRA